jgi:membrane protease subunit HflK
VFGKLSKEVLADTASKDPLTRKVYDSYKAAPEVTRRRMYLETMEDVLGDTDKIILDNKVSGSGVLPYLPLDSLGRGARPSSSSGLPGADAAVTAGSGGSQ